MTFQVTPDVKKSIINLLLFQVGWFACVLGGSAVALGCTALILMIHLNFCTCWKKERELLAITLLLGCSIDSFLGHLGILLFPGDSLLIPPWLACLWLLFGTTLRHSLAWTGQYKIAGAATGAIGGPLSYFAGAQLTEVSLAAPLWQTLLILAVIWALIIPILQAFSEVWLERYRRNSVNS